MSFVDEYIQCTWTSWTIIHALYLQCTVQQVFFAFFAMERICENYAREGLPQMCMRGTGTHLRCTNNNPPQISSIIHLFTFMRKFTILLHVHKSTKLLRL